MKWETVAELQRRLERPEHSGVRIAGGDRALYERMFRAEPRKYIARERFLITMWRVFGFEVFSILCSIRFDSLICILGRFSFHPIRAPFNSILI